MHYISDKDAATKIRKDLKASFPGVKFWVTSKNGINVTWIDGPTTKSVESIANRFQNIRRDQATGDILSGGNTYVFVNRLYSEEALKQGLSNVQAKNHVCWSKVDFAAVTFKPNYNERGFHLASQPEYTNFEYGYRLHLEDEIIKQLKDVDFTDQGTEPAQSIERVETSEPAEPTETVKAETPNEEIPKVLDVRAERYNKRKERRLESPDQLAFKFL